MDAPYSRTAGRRRSGRAGGRRFARAAACGAVALLVGALTGCGSKPPLEVEAPATVANATSGTPGTVVAMPGTLAWSFVNELLPTLNGEAGLAIVSVGGDRITPLGNWTTGPAWSTMKVPLTLAALRENSGYAGSATSAITYSDNSAADALWQSLGTPEAAAQAVEGVLREGGDTVTKVPATRTRSEYSAFGQANWSLTDQLRFASKLPCLAQADSVTGLMGRISYGQRWGLGTLEGAEFKGGWGPDVNGKYLVRQFGLIPVTGGQVAIAIAAQPTSGSFDEGTTMLTKVATLISQHLGELRGGTCAGAH